MNTSDKESLASVLAQMERTLDDLDKVSAPGQIGAHLDLAICRLREHLNAETRINPRGNSGQPPLQS